jgi:membrane protein implicated in regulation of membrane protease activity
MTWETFYLICFLVGLLLSAVSLFGALGHFGAHLHLPHSVDVPHMPHPVHLPHAPATADASAQGSGAVPWWNSFSIMIFLCWFGAAGYLLTRHSSFMAFVVLLVAVMCGVAGGAIVFLFLAKVMLPHEHELSADETAVLGAVGTVTCAIRSGGTGEIVYEQLGARRSAPARSDDGNPIDRQEEVFVVRYEKGIAYVRRWDDGGQ